MEQEAGRETAIPDVTLRWMLKRAQSNGLRLKNHWRDTLDSAPISAGEMAVNESWRGVWCLWRPKERCIPKGSKVHVSVDRLIEESGGRYRPRNLCLSGRYEVVET